MKTELQGSRATGNSATGINKGTRRTEHSTHVIERSLSVLCQFGLFLSGMFLLAPVRAEDVCYNGIAYYGRNGVLTDACSNGTPGPLQNINSIPDSLAPKGSSNDHNIVIVKESSTLRGDVYGAVNLRDTITVQNNTVFIGGTVGGTIYGGYADNAKAEHNAVFIVKGQINGNVYGGYSTNDTATNNTLTLLGGKFDSNSELYGGYSTSGGDVFSGNTLNVLAPVGVKGIRNFQTLNFYLPSTNQALVTLSANGIADLTKGGESSNISVDIISSAFQVNKEITLIDATATGAQLIINNDHATTNGNITSVLLEYEFDIDVKKESGVNKKLLATLRHIQTTPESQAFSESRLAATSLLNQGSDLLALRGISEAMRADDDSQVFGLIEGGKQRYDTDSHGSHIKSDNLSLLTGIALGIDLSVGRLTIGEFFEYGSSSYDSHSRFADRPNVQGSGDVWYAGAGLFGRIDFNANNSYFEASARGGRTHNQYSSVIKNIPVRYNKDVSDGYYGVHLGAGKIFRHRDSGKLDIYGNVFWTRQEDDSLKLSTNEEIDFDAIQSIRSRIGGRYIWNLSDITQLYVGAAWEHEFDGKAKAKDSRSGLSIETPSLRGDSGVGELGVILEPSAKHPLSLNLGVQGYGGKREGAALNLRAVYRF